MNTNEFQDHISTISANAAVTMAIGLGHNLGLFKLLCNADKPMSLEEIAEKMAFKERYTLEWLSCMVAANIIQQDRVTSLYHIPEGHCETLKLSVSVCAILFPMASRSQKLLSCFRKDGPYGIGYDENPDFFDFLDGWRADMGAHDLDVEVLPRLEEQGLISRLKSGIKVMDLGSGTGNYTIDLAKRFPNSHFTGVEYTDRALDISRRKCEEMSLSNVAFEYGDAQDLPEKFTDHFDMIFANDVIHDLPDPHKALAQIYRVMKDDAQFCLVEFGFHSDPKDNAGSIAAAMFYGISMFICLPTSMNKPPHIGYGACWGVEAMEKALLEKKFKIDKTIDKPGFFLCSK